MSETSIKFLENSKNSIMKMPLGKYFILQLEDNSTVNTKMPANTRYHWMPL